MQTTCWILVIVYVFVLSNSMQYTVEVNKFASISMCKICHIEGYSKTRKCS